MGLFPILAGVVAFMNMACLMFGAEAAYAPVGLVGVLLGVVGCFLPGKESKGSGRSVAIYAMLFAVLPMARPVVRDIAYRHRERRRAAEIAPVQKQLDGVAAALGPRLDAWNRKFGRYPAVANGLIYPPLRPDGTIVPTVAADVFSIPMDPFDAAAPVRVAPVGGAGALVISRGQNGVAELPEPLAAMDGEPSEPLALFAATGVDWRAATYDPTNGALGSGDEVRWVGSGAMDAAFKSLADAWDRANQAAPPQPIAEGKQNEAAARDGAGAEKLLAAREYLAALALASRARAVRDHYDKTWDESVHRAGLVRGLALYELGHPRAAADALAEYLDTRPNDVKGHYFCGAAMYLGGRAEEALVHFAAAAEIDLKDPLAAPAAECLRAIEANQTPNLPRPAIRGR